MLKSTADQAGVFALPKEATEYLRFYKLQDWIPTIEDKLYRQDRQKAKLRQLIHDGLLRGLEGCRFLKFLKIDDLVDAYMEIYIKRFGLFFEDFFEKYSAQLAKRFENIKNNINDDSDDSDSDDDIESDVDENDKTHPDNPFWYQIDALMHKPLTVLESGVTRSMNDLFECYDICYGLFDEQNFSLDEELRFLYIFIQMGVYEGHIAVKEVVREPFVFVGPDRAVSSDDLKRMRLLQEENYERNYRALVRDAKIDAFYDYLYRRFLC